MDKNINTDNILTSKQHTFVVCVYKESKYLESCIDSLKKQSLPGNIIITTSTPNDFILNIAKKYNIKVIINKNSSGIAGDWNFGYSQADSSLVTIAHQDDIYESEYLSELLKKVNRVKKPLIYFTNYYEIRGAKKVYSNLLLNIKRIMLFPLKIHLCISSIFLRRLILSFGSPVCCPSVTFVKNNLPDQIFVHQYRSNLDWQAWENISKYKGSFLYNSRCLVGHRIHAESETSNILNDNIRSAEDYEMFCKFWPPLIAKALLKIYKLSQKSNKLKK
ncbi:MAG TPA: glycosyl transferase family 2 [Actinobacteria bacterium]|nr:glycosyl transferase family 2 [Actinomycetota bacterium]